MNSEDFLRLALEWRNIEPDNACRECGGAGVKAYANTATYHRASISGQAITSDVCNACWGSGDRMNPWPTRRR